MPARRAVVLAAAMLAGASCGPELTVGDVAGGAGGTMTTGGAGGGAGGGGVACPGDRYVVVDRGTGSCNDSSGLVEDTATGLLWDRYPGYSEAGWNQAQADAYCQAQGARLPTKDEALAISGANQDSCVFPCIWSTWTSTSAGAGSAWVVSHGGDTEAGDVGGYDIIVLCVR